MAERVLTLRELNRATLARQLLLERKRLSATTVIERLVGVQAQWPPAPYVGIWTRTTSFRRGALERELARGAVVKANLMRMTLHLVTRRDYALLRAAISESNHADQWPSAKRVAPSIRTLAEGGPMTTADALALIEREHGLTGVDARRAWQGARMRAHVLHHHETALWHARPEGRLRRPGGAGGPRPARGADGDAAPVSRSLRACVAERRRRLEHDADAADRARARAARAAPPLPRRAGPRAPRRASRPAPGSRHAGSRPLPAQVGQRAARLQGPDAGAPGALPEARHPDER